MVIMMMVDSWVKQKNGYVVIEDERRGSIKLYGELVYVDRCSAVIQNTDVVIISRCKSHSMGALQVYERLKKEKNDDAINEFDIDESYDWGVAWKWLESEVDDEEEEPKNSIKVVEFVTPSTVKVKVEPPYNKDNEIEFYVKKLHFDKANHTKKVFFNASDVSLFELTSGEWEIYDYEYNIKYTEELRPWRSGIQLTFNKTAVQLLNLSDKKVIGFKVDPEDKRITIFKFDKETEDTLFNILNNTSKLND